ncbi:DUF2269 family protein [Aliikangiella coralliicola]|uniref:DUF2269 domain-containing protein n=1 Tax=Aliikangiella coralliicola TaxID=2592383 RepID=A0A545U7G8_9GAMM|nr:DUF2269 domain-containing protein [Aliikangiella coralliicola]TQV85417.1 DUF2269 domain-containing protein [Aliikangiella coralliicola]
MDSYLTVKLIHIIAAVVVAGTGSGIAFFMLMAVKSKEPQVIRVICRHVVLADWLFTAPAVVIQLISGLYLMELLGYSFTSPWFAAVISLFIFIGICWLPVIIIQYKLRKLSAEKSFRLDSSLKFQQLFKRWIFLGIPAFTAILILFWLMVFKPLAVT